jgi:hypothetical protein
MQPCGQKWQSRSTLGDILASLDPCIVV